MSLRPPAPLNPNPDRLDWVWLEPIELDSPGWTAGFPSTVNEELRRTGPRWVLTQGNFVADWIEAHCVFSDGRWIGRQVELLPWEVRLLQELFIIDPLTLRRRFRWALVGLPKKNGKTELAAMLGLYMVSGDREPAPLVVCAAASDEQADLVFGAATTMVEYSGPLKDIMVPEAQRITEPGNPRARMQRVAAAAGTNDGKHIHCVICDELHEWAPGKHERVWNVLTNGLGAREQPMVIQITTAGSDEETVCYRQYDLLCEVRDGTKEDPTFYGVWFEAPELDPATGEKLNYTTERAVALSNPSFGATVFWPFFEDQLSKKTEAVYRRYFLNQWTEADEIWEGAQEWDHCVGAPKLEEWLPLCVGIDIGLKHDAAAVVCAQWDEAVGAVHVTQRIWENPYGPNHPKHKQWRLSLDEVETHLRELFAAFPESAREDEEDYPMPGPAFFYDPMFFERSAQALRREGLNLLDYPQTDVRMVEASQRLFEVLKRRQLVHDGDPVMRRHIRSAAVKEAPRGWRIARPKGGRKPTDGAIAGAIAVVEATRDAELEYDAPPSLFGPTASEGNEPGRAAGLVRWQVLLADGREGIFEAPDAGGAVRAAREHFGPVGIAAVDRLLRGGEKTLDRSGRPV